MLLSIERWTESELKQLKSLDFNDLINKFTKIKTQIPNLIST